MSVSETTFRPIEWMRRHIPFAALKGRTAVAASLLSLALLLAFPLSGMAEVKRGHTETGIASFYHDRFQGRKTASGERFDQNDYSAAHKTLAFGTVVRVTRADSGKSVVVTINDRGPFKAGRVIDLSRQAARDLGMIDQGLVRVKVEVISLPQRGI
jgi:rare lipoprotein A